MTDGDTAPCRKCDTDISSSAVRCPACGYEPRTRGYPGVLLLLGIFFTIWIVTAPIGIPMIYFGLKFDKKRKGFYPTTTEPV